MPSLERDQEPFHGERRHWTRFPIEGKTELAVVVDGRRLRCDLIDISMGGAKLRFDGEPPLVPAVSLDHPQMGAMSGDCIWRQSGYLGLRFDPADLPPGQAATHACP